MVVNINNILDSCSNFAKKREIQKERATMHANLVINENPGLTETQYRELFWESYNKYGDELSKQELKTAREAFEKAYAQSLKANATIELSKEARAVIDKLNQNSYKAYSPEVNLSGKTHEEWLSELENAIDYRKGNTDKEIIDSLIKEANNTKELNEAKELIKASGTNEQKLTFVRKYKEFKKQEELQKLMKENKQAEIREALNNAEASSEHIKKGIPLKSAEESARVFMENPDELVKMDKLADERISKNITEKAVETATEAADEVADKSKSVVETVKGEGKKLVEEGEKVVRKMPTWGWVALGITTAAALIAGVSAHNKNKQQQQLNTVA